MSDLPARLQKLRVRDLLLLEYIAQSGSLQRVAERLHVTQPAVTMALQALEDAFGAELVQRGRRGVTLTTLGESVLRRVTVGRKELAQAYALASNPAAPHLRLGSSPIASLRLLPAALAKLYRQASHEEIRISVTESAVPALWEMLNQGDLDAIVCPMPNAAQLDLTGPGMRVETVGAERMVLVASRASALGGAHTDMATLAAQRWILPPKGSLAYPVLAEWFAQSGLPPPLPTITSASFQTSLAIAAKVGMVTLAPESVARDLADALDLEVIETENEWRQTPLVLAYRVTSECQDIIAMLRSGFASNTSE
ncbi:LysR family transcriptional regulator [Paraburkholderia strydomiana]|uniref:LysR family transcriptional regulator n=1 Tax=Paraburkholderia strydomiana TaxID=1245417 RepID=UPI0038BDFBF8